MTPLLLRKDLPLQQAALDVTHVLTEVHSARQPDYLALQSHELHCTILLVQYLCCCYYWYLEAMEVDIFELMVILPVFRAIALYLYQKLVQGKISSLTVE